MKNLVPITVSNLILSNWMDFFLFQSNLLFLTPKAETDSLTRIQLELARFNGTANKTHDRPGTNKSRHSQTSIGINFGPPAPLPRINKGLLSFCTAAAPNVTRGMELWLAEVYWRKEVILDSVQTRSCLISSSSRYDQTRRNRRLD